MTIIIFYFDSRHYKDYPSANNFTAIIFCKKITADTYMELFIDNDSKVEDISKLFTARYPYLKIEFYKRNFANTSLKKEVIPFHIPLAKVIKKNLKVVINLKSNMTVEELENDFLVIGLQAEVFRKSGKVWVETSLTTNWTLQQQNLAGEEISRHF